MAATALISASDTPRVSAEFVVDATTGPALLLGRRGSGAGSASGWKVSIEAKCADGSFVAFDKLDNVNPTGMLAAYATYRLSTGSNCVVDRG